MVEAHLSILLVVVPLLAAPVTALLPGSRLPWSMAMFVTLLCLVMSYSILVDVAQGNHIHYELGGWAPPWGIAYEIDGLNALVAFTICLVGSLVTVYAFYSVPADIPEAGSEELINVELDLQGLRAAGFRLYLFYPETPSR